ncbi:MAG: PHP domain-containing protein, partial [Firmicutes bacterium]|nr:PHP domain-containing protein [Bacillota bacterium]
EIYDFYVKDGKAVVDCSPVAKIRMHSDAHPTRIIRNEEGLITHGEFDLKAWEGPFGYVRITVIDEKGKHAWTNPIFLNE